MVRLFILLLLCVVNNLSYADESGYKKFINFNHKSESGEKLKSEDFAGYDELQRWALFQSLKLLPDSDKDPHGLKDGICRMIPSEGFSFYLTADSSIKKRIYVYLDLTTYVNINNTSYPVRSLNVFLNNQLKKTVYFDRNKIHTNPTIVYVDPSEIRGDRITIKLVPASSSTGRFWGIWDAYYSYIKEE